MLVLSFFGQVALSETKNKGIDGTLPLAAELRRTIDS